MTKGELRIAREGAAVTLYNAAKAYKSARQTAKDLGLVIHSDEHISAPCGYGKIKTILLNGEINN